MAGRIGKVARARQLRPLRALRVGCVLLVWLACSVPIPSADPVRRPYGGGGRGGAHRHRSRPRPLHGRTMPPSSARVHRSEKSAPGSKGGREITLRLARACSAEEIIGVFERDSASFNDINVCTMWNQLGKARMSRRERAELFRQHELSLLLLQSRTERIIDRLTPRNLAGVPHGMARLGFPPARATMATIGEVAATRTHELSSQELANLCLAFATAGVAAPALFRAIAREALPRLHQYNAQELANTAWAFAKAAAAAGDAPVPQPAQASPSAEGAGSECARLLQAIAAEAEPRLPEFIPQGLANTAWAFATAGVRAEGFFDSLGAEAAPRLHAFKPQEVANLAWAYATAGVPAERLFDAIAHDAFARVGAFTPQGLSNLVWAYGKAGVESCDFLFEAVAREIVGGSTVAGERRPSRVAAFKSQELANTAYAFARVGHRDERLFAAVGAEALPRLHEFNEQELANLAWAHAAVGVANGRLLEAIAARLCADVRALSPPGLCNTVLAFAKASWPLRDADALMGCLAEEVRARAPALSAAECSTLAWAFALSRHVPEALAAALVARAAALGEAALTLEERAALHQFQASLQLEGAGSRAQRARAEAAGGSGPSAAEGAAEGTGGVGEGAHRRAAPALTPAGPRAPVPSLPPAMRAACLEAMSMQTPASSSQLHMDVSGTLRRLGVEHVNELCVPGLGYHVDIAIVRAARGGGGPAAGASSLEALALAACARAREGLVVEVNGPSHYDAARRARPESAMKVRHLQLAGWTVVDVPWWEWGALHTAARKAEYLHALLATAAAPAEPAEPAAAPPRANGREAPRALPPSKPSDAATGSADGRGEARAEDVIDRLVASVKGLSHARGLSLRAHVGARDPFSLSAAEWRCPGVGSRLAERIVQELRRDEQRQTS